MNSYVVIMAGGIGTRLWPLSRYDKPKQTHDLIGKRTMFQSSVDRLLPLFGYSRIFVVANEELSSQLSKQVSGIPEENFIIEPEGKGTAPCIGLSAIHIMRKNPDAVMVVVTADHYVKDVKLFQEALKLAMEVSEKGYLVTLGISPTHPSTGYGYINQGEKLYDGGEASVYRVESFTEKPDEDTAIQMLNCGGFSWNSGMFVWRIDRIMEEFKRQMPELYQNLTKISEEIGTSTYSKSILDIWANVEKQTIDYGVMEGAEDVVVIPLDIGWSDIGTWSSLANLLQSDDNGNVLIGKHIGIDTFRSLIYGDKRLIATIGLEDMVIVDTDDALLICSKKHDQKVREIVNKLEENNFSEFL